MERRNWFVMYDTGEHSSPIRSFVVQNMTAIEAYKYIEKLPGVDKYKYSMCEATITIEVSGGVVQNVSGLPSGWQYQVCDWDNCSRCGGLDLECECKER